MFCCFGLFFGCVVGFNCIVYVFVGGKVDLIKQCIFGFIDFMGIVIVRMCLFVFDIEFGCVIQWINWCVVVCKGCNWCYRFGGCFWFGIGGKVFLFVFVVIFVFVDVIKGCSGVEYIGVIDLDNVCDQFWGYVQCYVDVF